jgi:putative SOS response-associated peptidase YedK
LPVVSGHDTRAANAAITPLHDRMQIFIQPLHFGWWVKTDDPRCIEPVRIDRDFFERQWWGDE